MSAFPAITWDLNIDSKKILSGTPEALNQQQENLIRQIKRLGEQNSEGIYGLSNRWTPVAEGGTSAGVASSYGVQVGHYQRFGHMCWFTMNLQWNDADHTGTGDLTITGLPAPVKDVTNAKVIFPAYNSESGSGFVGMAFMEPDSKTISVIKNGATTLQINGADYDLQITGMYRVK